MSDGIATHDWRELRAKTLKEIEEHRKNPVKRVYPSSACKTHFMFNGKTYCGSERKSVCPVDSSENAEKVDCALCLKRLKVVPVNQNNRKST